MTRKARAYALDLAFVSQKPDDFPYPMAKAWVKIRSCSKAAETGDAMLISPDAMDYQELKRIVEELRGDLDEVLLKARRRFREAGYPSSLVPPG